MAIKFKSLTRHGSLAFSPLLATAFEDDRAEDYFVAAGWAERTDEPPLVTYPVGSVEVDPSTVFADGPNRGQLVMEV